MKSDGGPAAASRPSSSSRAERIAKVGTVISAILASSCCWLPLLLLGVGVSGAGIASTLGAYRTPFMVVTFAFLGMAFYFTYRPRRNATSGTDCCASPEAAAADCCAPRSGSRSSMVALNKVMLWVVTILAVAFLFFPGYFTSVLTPAEGEFTDGMTRTVIQVEGMTCEGCVPPAARAIREAPGVLAVKVDYETRSAVIGTAPGREVPRTEIVSALKAVGFSGEFPGSGSR